MSGHRLDLVVAGRRRALHNDGMVTLEIKLKNGKYLEEVSS